MNRSSRLATALLLFLVLPVWAIDIEEERWGFEGSMFGDAPALLSVYVQNNSPEAFPGPLLLEPAYGGGIVKSQPCYLAPYTGRWVQFTLAGNAGNDWELVWTEKKVQRYRLRPARRSNQPVCVVLVPEQRDLTTQTRLPVFPANLWPNSLPATLQLQTLVLDHMPDWPEVKRQTFRDWLQSGGQVLVAQEREGRFPTFSGDLAFLNEDVAFGRGRIARLPKTARSLGPEDVPAPASLSEPDNNGHTDVDSILLSYLRRNLLPDHPWGLINFLSFVYLLLVGPVALLLFRRRIRKVRWSLLYLLVTVLGFSMLFHQLGRRGYGERACTNELIYARWLGGDRYQIRSWSQAFVTDSGDYQFQFGPGHHLITVPDQGGGVDLRVQDGASGFVQARLPVFSSVGFQRESVLPGPAIRVTRQDGAVQLEGFAFAPRLEWGWWVDQGRVHQLNSPLGDIVRWNRDGRDAAEQWFANEHYWELQRNWGRSRHSDSRRRSQDTLATQLLAAEGLQLLNVRGSRQQRSPRPELTDGQHLLLAMPAPEAFLVQHPDLRKRSALLLLHIDFTLLENQE